MKSIKLVVKKRTRKPEDDKSSGILQTRRLNPSIIKQETLPAGQLKRHNPFGCSVRKKANITKVSENDENVTHITPEKSLSGLASNIAARDFSIKHQLQTFGEDEATGSVRLASGTKLPADWSLKTRLRFISSQSFQWCSKILAKQEAEGICNFVHCQDPNALDSACFQQNIMYWIHPVLPWLSLFPRLTSEVKLTTKVPNVAENSDIAEALQSRWCQSFHSLFNLLRCGKCDYFYLCAAQLTVLFRAANIGGMAKTSAYITPTTKGIREGFDKEGK